MSEHRPNCIVPLSREMLTMLLGVEVIDLRVSPSDDWRKDMEMLVHRPGAPETAEGGLHPRACLTITGPLPQVVFES